MKIGIIGAGVMGLVLAYRLSALGHKVEIIEAAPQIGGLSTWVDYGDFVWDKYYHVILRSDEHLIRLIDELGLLDQLCWTETKTGFLWKGRHISMSNHWEFLCFPALGLFEKFRLGAGILYCARVKNTDPLEKISAVDWLTKVFGKGVYQTIWEPLLQSKFGVLKEKIPASIMHSTIQRYYSTRGNDGKEHMGHLRNVGLKVLLEELSSRIHQAGGQIYCEQMVSNIDELDSQVLVQTNQKNLTFDRVISTVPSTLLKKIAPQLQMSFPSVSPQFLGVIRLSLVLRKSLSPYYVTNLIDQGYPFTGVVEVSALTTQEELGDNHLVMLPRYDVPTSEWFDRSDEEITTIFLQHLKRTWPDIEDDILSSCVHRNKIVMGLWLDGRTDLDQPLSTPSRKVISVNSELSCSTLNNNTIVQIANRAVDEWL